MCLIEILKIKILIFFTGAVLKMNTELMLLKKKTVSGLWIIYLYNIIHYSFFQHFWIVMIFWISKYIWSIWSMTFQSTCRWMVTLDLEVMAHSDNFPFHIANKFWIIFSNVSPKINFLWLKNENFHSQNNLHIIFIQENPYICLIIFHIWD